MKIKNIIIGALTVVISGTITANAAGETTLIKATDQSGFTYSIEINAKGYVSCENIELNDKEITILSKLVWGEAREIESDEEQAAIVWTVLNRVDNTEWGKTITEVVTQPNQFFYRSWFPVDDEIYELCSDILYRWELEQAGVTDINIGRVIPNDYYYYWGDGCQNYFRKSLEGKERYEFWDWSFENPYEN